jgi:hypothetical protein
LAPQYQGAAPRKQHRQINRYNPTPCVAAVQSAQFRQIIRVNDRMSFVLDVESDGVGPIQAAKNGAIWNDSCVYN